MLNIDENIQPNKYFSLIAQYISQLLKTNLLPETTISLAQPTFIC